MEHVRMNEDSAPGQSSYHIFENGIVLVSLLNSEFVPVLDENEDYHLMITFTDPLSHCLVIPASTLSPIKSLDMTGGTLYIPPYANQAINAYAKVHAIKEVQLTVRSSDRSVCNIYKILPPPGIDWHNPSIPWTKKVSPADTYATLSFDSRNFVVAVHME